MFKYLSITRSLELDFGRWYEYKIYYSQGNVTTYTRTHSLKMLVDHLSMRQEQLTTIAGIMVSQRSAEDL